MGVFTGLTLHKSITDCSISRFKNSEVNLRGGDIDGYQ